MSLNVLRFRHGGRPLWGVVREGAITVIPGEFATTRAFLEANPIETLSKLNEPTLNEGDVELHTPVTQNQQFLCQGANYRQHMIESGVDPDAKTFNMIFTKAPSCIAPANADGVRPRRVRFLDYEIYKDGFSVASGRFEPREGTPLFINGPYFHSGMFIFVLEARPQ